MYRIFMTNFDYWREEEFESLGTALAFGKSKGFDFSVHDDRGLVAYWSFFGGVRHYREKAL